MRNNPITVNINGLQYAAMGETNIDIPVNIIIEDVKKWMMRWKNLDFMSILNGKCGGCGGCDYDGDNEK